MVTDPFATPTDHDRRYAHVVLVHEVHECGFNDVVLLRTCNKTDAERMVAAHRRPSICTIETMRVATYIPDPRPLYDLRVLIAADPSVPVPPRPEIHQDMQIPGWDYAPEAMPLERPVGSVHQEHGWTVHVNGCDREQVTAEFDRLLAEAVDARDARWEALRPYTDGTAVRYEEEILVRRIRSAGNQALRYWGSGGDRISDRDIDPTKLTILVPGATPQDGATS